MTNEKEVSYQTTNTYSTLNDFTEKTKNVWVVFHGIGYLSRYFQKYFRHLNKEENYIIAPQAPSKYYLNGKYEHVGASWATRENTELEIQNLLAYLDEIYKTENLENAPNLILFGYSQGVSVVSRWVARRKINCSRLIFHSGRLPQELKSEDFIFLGDTEVSFVYGTDDPFVSEEFLASEKERLKTLFPKNLKLLPFDGGHEVNKEIILKLAEE
ncbi:Predicted esterase [Salinimicrobium catena]|uniref:Predicted esterase n=1 Tax=Salinimicrobium catena TaxID=390640 RepID=A0A1H5LI46_9FLAO|nr:esterase [Salinimicrobium catena]SDL09566.1 Predicted esterase [Salinimicrobium catena]SEE75858.1 Predicted esterase [Salinimicrobium catena]